LSGLSDCSLTVSTSACGQQVERVQQTDREDTAAGVDEVGPEHVSEEWGHQSDQPDVKRLTCAHWFGSTGGQSAEVLSLFSSHGERVDVRDVPATRSGQRLNRASSTARQDGAGNDGRLAYAADEPAPTPAGPVLPERIGDGLNPLKVR
jgi:hypothetical protein